MTAAALLLYVLSVDGTLTRPDGVILLLGGVAYTAGLVRVSRRDAADPAEGPEAAVTEAAGHHRPVRHVLVLLVAMVVVVVGAHLLVDGAVSTARTLGVSDAIIGLTIVAVGTSAPEPVTTVVSTLRGDRDLAVGNLTRIEGGLFVASYIGYLAWLLLTRT